MELDTPVMRDALARVLSACRKHGKLACIFCGDAAAKARILEGFHSVAVGLDVLVYINAYRAITKDILESTGEPRGK